MRYGYACINLTLAAENIKVNRSMIKRMFLEKGIAQASAVALANFTDLEKLINWNIQHNMTLYRMSSDMVPWMSEFDISDMPDYEAIKDICKRCATKITENHLRLTYHPGPFNVLAANSDSVLQKTIRELNQHAEIMDLLQLPVSPFAKINIHVGGAYGDKYAALGRFAENYSKLPDTTRKRLSVENDDKAKMYSVQDVLWLYQQTGIPIAFDYFHHSFCPGNLNEAEAFQAATSTWPTGIRPIVHFSSSKKIYEDPAAVSTAHANHLYNAVNTYGTDVDIMFEAKGKDIAVLKYVRDFVENN